MADPFKLKGTVGPHNEVDPRDSRKVKQALMRLGHLDSGDVESLEFVDSPTLAALKTFQEQGGLDADGIAKPGGPTEDMIAEALAERETSTSQPADRNRGSVRDGGAKTTNLAQTQKPAGAGAQQTGSGTISSPVAKQTVIRGFGPRPQPLPGASTMHKGVDFKAPLGTAILSTHDGTVHTIGDEPARSGNFILIQNSDGSMSGYAHTGPLPTLRQGQKVRSGEQIGESNGSGNVTGPHLHYTYRPGTKAQPATRKTPRVDPFKTVFKGMKPTP